MYLCEIMKRILPSTPAPSSNLHLRGPQYGMLFKTDAPLPVDEDALVEDTSSSPTIVYGTTAILLLIPAAVSMILF